MAVVLLWDGRITQEERDNCRANEDDEHGVTELLQQEREPAVCLRWLSVVRAECSLACLLLGFLDADVNGHLEIGKDLLSSYTESGYEPAARGPDRTYLPSRQSS